MGKLNSSNDDLRRLLDQHCLEPFIRSIRFPYYKSLAPGEFLSFTFPLTVLVGKNGCNKSSILRALYGCPGNYSTGLYWFSTELDPIKEYSDSSNNARNCYFYEYYHLQARRNVQVLKTRIRKKFKAPGNKELEDPDYWEPSRPVKSLGMDFSDEEKEARKKFSSLDTRWEPIVKDVLLLELRSQLSAFDKYFYFADMKATRSLRNKQDRLRKWALPLKKVIDENRKSYVYFSHNKVDGNDLLSENDTKCISNILGQEYTQIRQIDHSFYHSKGTSFLFRKQESNAYTEAFAGSGEFSVALMVSRISQAPCQSLILLDEPETSLHPGAQVRLLQFLREQIVRNKHQIVVSTHSPILLEGLPNDAVKIVEHSPRGVVINNSAIAEEAFNTLETPPLDTKRLMTEDRLAAEIVSSAIGCCRPKILASLKITHISKGAEDIWKNHVIAAFDENDEKAFFIFDGDKDPRPSSGASSIDWSKILSEDDETARLAFSGISDSTQENVLQAISRNKKLSLYGSVSVSPSSPEARNKRLAFLNYVRKHVFYLPFDIPEKFIYNLLQESYANTFDFSAIERKARTPSSNPDYYKDLLAECAASLMGSNTATDLRSICKMALNAAKKDHALFEGVESSISRIYDNA